MAVAVPDAFDRRELAFALPYVGVRVVGTALNAAIAWTDQQQRPAVRIFTIVSIGGLVAVVFGAVIGGGTQYWFWGFAIFLDLIAAALGGKQAGWNLYIEHFSERHGLFVIIALGETMIVAGIGISGQE